MGQHRAGECTLYPGATKMMLLAVNARSIRMWGKFGLLHLFLGLKLLGRVLGNKDMVSQEVRSLCSPQPMVCGNGLIKCKLMTCPDGIAGPGPQVSLV